MIGKIKQREKSTTIHNRARSLGNLVFLCILLAPCAIIAQPHDWKAQGRAVEKKSDLEQSARFYSDLLNTYPQNEEVRAALARVLSWDERYDEALALYRDILSRHPEDVDLRTALARVLSWQNKYQEAKEEFHRVLHEAPSNLEAQRGLADALFYNGEYAAALRYYEKLPGAPSDRVLQQRIEAAKAEMAKPPATASKNLKIPRFPFRDYIKIGYSHYTYSNNIPDERNGLVEAGKPIGPFTVVGRVEPLNRFGFHDTQLSGELFAPLWKSAWGYWEASYSPDPAFAARWTTGGELFQGLGIIHPILSAFVPSVGYRHLAFRTETVDLLIPGMTIYFPHDIWLTEKLVFVPDTGAIALSSQLFWRPTDRVQVYAAGNFGTASERINATQDIARFSSQGVRGGFIVPVTNRYSLEAFGFYEDREQLYVRRGGGVSLLYHW